MEIYEEMWKTLKDEYDSSRMTYQEIADKHKSSYSYIRALIQKRQPVSGMSLELFFKMFPNAKITLNGNTGNVATGGVAVAGNGNNFFSDSDNRMKKLEEAVMSSDLPAEAKVKVYQMIKETK